MNAHSRVHCFEHPFVEPWSTKARKGRYERERLGERRMPSRVRREWKASPMGGGVGVTRKGGEEVVEVEMEMEGGECNGV